ncbi:hypothetical protein V8C35DRAFT_191788 [Trichoderma chlorosporum]
MYAPNHETSCAAKLALGGNRNPTPRLQLFSSPLSPRHPMPCHVMSWLLYANARVVVGINQKERLPVIERNSESPAGKSFRLPQLPRANDDGGSITPSAAIPLKSRHTLSIVECHIVSNTGFPAPWTCARVLGRPGISIVIRAICSPKSFFLCSPVRFSRLSSPPRQGFYLSVSPSRILYCTAPASSAQPASRHVSSHCGPEPPMYTTQSRNQSTAVQPTNAIPSHICQLSQARLPSLSPNQPGLAKMPHPGPILPLVRLIPKRAISIAQTPL